MLKKRRAPLLALKLYLLWFSIMALAGCATPYQHEGFRGGYTDVQVEEDTFRVDFQGNGYTSKRTVELYLLYRCAEITVKNGFDYFVLLDRSSEHSVGSYTTPGSFNASSAEGYTTGTFNPGQTFSFNAHGASVLIRLSRGEKPKDLPGAFNANAVLKNLTKEVQQ